jgi:urease accessory protein
MDMNTIKMKKNLVYIVTASLAAITVQAHQIGGIGVGSGVSHPLTGLDHLLAMVAVGIISTRLGGRWIWKIPAAFVSFMVIGGALAIYGINLQIAEGMIALSVLALGVLIAWNKKISPYFAMLCVSLFAICHGHAHGEELPVIASPVIYVAGFVLSTTMLHITGIIIAKKVYVSAERTALLRYAGAAMGVFGLMLIAGL